MSNTGAPEGLSTSKPVPNPPRWRVWIDTGGTFTDCLARDPAGKLHRAKVLTSGALRGVVEEVIDDTHLRVSGAWSAPANLLSGFAFRMLNVGAPDAPVPVDHYDPVSNILALSGPAAAASGRAFEVISPEEAPLLAARLVIGTPAGQALPAMEMRLATTRGTNALLERRGARVALFITHGFGDLLVIGDQSRPDLFTLDIRKPLPLYESVIEVPERLTADGSVLQAINLTALDGQVQELLARGITAAAVALLHSYRNPAHELELVAYLKRAGFRTVSTSSDLAPFIKILPRTQTAVVDAYLSPLLDEYRKKVWRGLEARGEAHGGEQRSLLMMTSAGSLVDAGEFRAKDSLLSGPAGGVVGAVRAAGHCGFARAIAFDMGGTSTDVARYDGAFEYTFEHRVGDALLNAPALAIESVAAGGGSICRFERGTLQVGPDSAGARPGPACYAAGGPLTLTDVHLLLGRLEADRFPIPIRSEAAVEAFRPIREAVEQSMGESVDSDRLLEGFLDVANERMADVIRSVSLRQGYEPSDYCLVAFGGAGGQHACAVASRLRIRTVLAPADAGLLSAVGLGAARIERFAERQILKPLTAVNGMVASWLAELEREARAAVVMHGITAGEVEVSRRMVHLRLMGQDSTISVEYEDQAPLAEQFSRRYAAIFGHRPSGKPVELESIRVVAVSRSGAGQITAEDAAPARKRSPDPAPRPAYFERQWLPARRFERGELEAGAEVAGPAIIFDLHSATVVEPGWTAVKDEMGALILQDRADAPPGVRVGMRARSPESDVEAIQIELFTNRFSAVGREMGEMLRRTAVSTNIKERLDFSCALLDAAGELVVNAPHIPVHLGALGLCVRRLAETLRLQPGDAAVTNHPAFGGSHLPDVTVVTPVFHLPHAASAGEPPAAAILLGYVASRAHHAEIGGSRPGSMPPAATTLAEEGVVIAPSFVMRGGVPLWEEMRRQLESGPYPSRAVKDNIADMQAAVAANQRGAAALAGLAQQYGAATVQHYMAALTDRAEQQARSALRRLPEGTYSATEFLDDGSPLSVRIEIGGGEAIVDFAGSAPVHPGNLNSTPAIVRSAVMYVVRLLVNEPLPLNEGLMRAVTIRLPAGILNPDFPEDPARSPAVVGGNVETSQRLVDTLLKALQMAACSQGTMNNTLFGSDRFGYYETVCGGCGAGPGFDGASAVHSHMTNTRITDAEILEHRYPVRVERFSVRRGSGGKGQWRGGDGVLRELRFLEPAAVSVMTQHRTEGPYGTAGGQPGKAGGQRILRPDGKVIELKALDAFDAMPGDRLLLETPGGGGWGAADGEGSEENE